MKKIDRSEYIGSSDARDIIAGNYAQLYRAKVDGVKPDFTDNFPVQLGIHTEDFHCLWTIRKFNAENDGSWQASKGPREGDQHFATFQPDDRIHNPLLGSSPDYLLRDLSGTIYPLEVKHTGRFKDAEEAADYYMPQLQHHMLCWGVDQILFSVICGNAEPERVWIGASAEWQRHYLDRCETFWAHLSTQTPPPSMTYVHKPDVVPAAIKNTIPYNGMRKVDVSSNNALPGLLRTFLETKDAVKRHEQVKDDLKSMVADDMRAIFADGFLLERNAKGALLFKKVDPAVWLAQTEPAE